MAGHNKWSSIKHKKAKVDAQRGKIFTKLIKEISVAARMGGGDQESNSRLRTAVANARNANMPKENIEKAIKKGTGELPGVNYEEMSYEGYGPGGVAIFVETLTDNKNRTAGEIRHLFSKHNGNMGESGCVSWMFDTRGEIVIEGESLSEDELIDAAAEAGANDAQFEDGTALIYTEKEDLAAVSNVLTEKGYPVKRAALTRIPSNTVKVEGKTAEGVIKLLEALEDHDDVQHVYANFDMPDEVLQKASA